MPAVHRNPTPVRLATAALFVAIVGLSACSSSKGSASNAGSSSSAAAPTSGAASPVATVPPRPSAGCQQTQPAAQLSKRQTIAVGGTGRWYLLSNPAPAATTKPRPLVVDFHGLSEGAQAHVLMSKLGDLGQKEGFVVVTPNGTQTPVQWDVTAPPATNKDVAFIKAFLAKVEAQQCIDTARVYATGLSDGAFMTSYVGCNMADTFAAIAPVAGVQHPATCKPGREVPVLAFHGTQDPILYFNGGIGTGKLNSVLGPKNGLPTTSEAPTTTEAPQISGAGYPEHVKAWATANGCNPTPTDTRISSEVIHRVYSCPAGTAVEFYIVLGGGHAWPGSAFSQSIAKFVGYTTMQIDASKLDWAFFKRFALPAS
jgi:polyhydroxybutyrate depolymerase